MRAFPFAAAIGVLAAIAAAAFAAPGGTSPEPAAPVAGPGTAPPAPPAQVTDDPTARRLMLEIEAGQRAGHRFFSVDVEQRVAGFDPVRRRMLGLASGDARAARVLYAYAWPRAFRGAALLLEDPVPPALPDHLWLEFPALRSFREVDARSLRLLVPGTGLTYEDARGWIAPERYRFATLAADGPERTIEARPANDSLAQVVGSRRLVIRADAARRVVRSIEFLDAAGRPFKTYEATEFTLVGGRWYPAKVRTVHEPERTEATLEYRYRPLAAAPPAGLFRHVEGGPSLLDRLLRWRNRNGWAGAYCDTIAAEP
jgi:hypothetical protein